MVHRNSDVIITSRDNGVCPHPRLGQYLQLKVVLPGISTMVAVSALEFQQVFSPPPFPELIDDDIEMFQTSSEGRLRWHELLI